MRPSLWVGTANRITVSTTSSASTITATLHSIFAMLGPCRCLPSLLGRSGCCSTPEYCPTDNRPSRTTSGFAAERALDGLACSEGPFAGAAWCYGGHCGRPES